MPFPSPVLSPAAISTASVAQSTWTTLSSGAPAGATGMVVLLTTSSGGGAVAREFRKTGSTDNYVTDSMGANQQIVRWVGLKAGQSGVNDFDFFNAASVVGEASLYPLCYFGSEAVFPTAIIAMASTLTTSYVNTYSTGGNAPSALAAVFNIHGGGDYYAYFRHPSSTDAFDCNNESASGRRDWFCALNGSQQYSAKAGNAGRQPYLVAYFTSNVVIPTNGIGVTRTPGTAGSYQNLSVSGDTSPIAIPYYLHFNTTSEAYQLSGQGTSWTAPNLASAGGFGAPGFAYAPAQANIASTSLVVSEMAYFTAGAATAAGTQGMLLGVGD